jgi:hypothetical protein
MAPLIEGEFAAFLKMGRQLKEKAEKDKKPTWEFKDLYQSPATELFKNFESSIMSFTNGIDKAITEENHRLQMLFMLERALAVNALATMDEFEEEKTLIEVISKHKLAIHDMAFARKLLLANMEENYGDNFEKCKIQFMDSKLTEFVDDLSGDTHFSKSIRLMHELLY